jgi:hypothetical protein
MKHQDFYFWLQGYFELRADDDAFTDVQLDYILNHLNLVKKVDGPLGGFAAWIDGMLSAFVIARRAGPGYPGQHAFTKSIQEKLSECFAHEVDNKYDAGKHGAKAELAEIHKPHHPPFDPGSTLIRC